MKKIGICILAYGEEHIDETNFLIENLLKYNNQINIYVCTDNIHKLHKNVNQIIFTNEDFNYNLKRISVSVALNECDIIVMMDSDIIIRNGNVNFHDLNYIDDGLYSSLLSTNYKRLRKFNYTEPYQKFLYGQNSHNDLRCIFEYLVILKITDKQKKADFINNWNFLYNETKNIQPYSFDGSKYGAMEGLIMYVSSMKSNIKNYDSSDNPISNCFFNCFYHYNSEKDKLFFKKNQKKLL